MKYARILLGSLAALALAAGNIASADSRDPDESDEEVASIVSRWTVTDAVFDPETRALTMRHIVPFSDMADYGTLANINMVGNGLRLDSVDARFAQADVDLNEPHYHFTQSFTTTN